MIRLEFELDWFRVVVYCECDVEAGMGVYSMGRGVYYDVIEFGDMLDWWRGLRASCHINALGLNKRRYSRDIDLPSPRCRNMAVAVRVADSQPAPNFIAVMVALANSVVVSAIR